MYTIPIILGTVRTGRQSEKAAKYIESMFRRSTQILTELLDLRDWSFPFLSQRYRFQDNPPKQLRDFSEKMDGADAVVIVAPEYNSGYPGVLKNALDHFLPEFTRKPIGIVTVSSGMFGGINCMQQLRQVCHGLDAFAIPMGLAIPYIGEVFDEQGVPVSEAFEVRGKQFLDELLWYTEAITDRRNKQV